MNLSVVVPVYRGETFIEPLVQRLTQTLPMFAEKYEIIRNAILSVLCAQKEMTFMKLTDAVEKEVDGKFEGSVTWYVTTVKLDMEARGEVKRVPHSRPQLIRLV